MSLLKASVQTSTETSSHHKSHRGKRQSRLQTPDVVSSDSHPHPKGPKKPNTHPHPKEEVSHSHPKGPKKPNAHPHPKEKGPTTTITSHDVEKENASDNLVKSNLKKPKGPKIPTIETTEQRIKREQKAAALAQKPKRQYETRYTVNVTDSTPEIYKHLKNVYVIPMKGDGSCMYHSLYYAIIANSKNDLELVKFFNKYETEYDNNITELFKKAHKQGIDIVEYKDNYLYLMRYIVYSNLTESDFVYYKNTDDSSNYKTFEQWRLSILFSGLQGDQFTIQAFLKALNAGRDSKDYGIAFYYKESISQHKDWTGSKWNIILNYIQYDSNTGHYNLVQPMINELKENRSSIDKVNIEHLMKLNEMHKGILQYKHNYNVLFKPRTITLSIPEKSS